MNKAKAILASYIGVIVFAAVIIVAGGRLFIGKPSFICYWQFSERQ
jgi:hypothetical protein